VSVLRCVEFIKCNIYAHRIFVSGMFVYVYPSTGTSVGDVSGVDVFTQYVTSRGKLIFIWFNIICVGIVT